MTSSEDEYLLTRPADTTLTTPEERKHLAVRDRTGRDEDGCNQYQSSARVAPSVLVLSYVTCSIKVDNFEQLYYKSF